MTPAFHALLFVDWLTKEGGESIMGLTKALSLSVAGESVAKSIRMAPERLREAGAHLAMYVMMTS